MGRGTHGWGPGVRMRGGARRVLLRAAQAAAHPACCASAASFRGTPKAAAADCRARLQLAALGRRLRLVGQICAPGQRRRAGLGPLGVVAIQHRLQVRRKGSGVACALQIGGMHAAWSAPAPSLHPVSRLSAACLAIGAAPASQGSIRRRRSRRRHIRRADALRGGHGLRGGRRGRRGSRGLGGWRWCSRRFGGWRRSGRHWSGRLCGLGRWRWCRRRRRRGRSRGSRRSRRGPLYRECQ